MNSTLVATSVVGQTIFYIGWAFLVLLLARLVFEYVFLFARDFHPTGALLVVVEVVYTVTDPPVKLFRRFIPPLRMGGVSLDLSFMVLMLLVLILINVVAPLL